MDPVIYTKEDAGKFLLDNAKFAIGEKDWEQFDAITEELETLAKMDAPFIRIEECPMSRSGIMLRPRKDSSKLAMELEDKLYHHRDELPQDIIETARQLVQVITETEEWKEEE